jgi:hypothetical protein
MYKLSNLAFASRFLQIGGMIVPSRYMVLQIENDSIDILSRKRLPILVACVQNGKDSIAEVFHGEMYTHLVTCRFCSL